MKYTVVLSGYSDGRYTATSPAFPGLVVEADGRTAVLAVAADLMHDFLEHGESPIPETPVLISREVENVLQDRIEEGLDPAIEIVSISPGALAVAS